MARIVIDGREMLGTTGRYIRKLLEYLQQLDADNEYLILLHRDGYERTDLSAGKFKKVLVREKKFTFAEQLSLPKTITKLKPDLVHFTMTNQPAFLNTTKVTTLHDLTPIKFRNLQGNSLLYRFRSYVFGWLTKRAIKSSQAVFTGSQYVNDEVVAFSGVDSSKIITTLEAADEILGEAKSVENLEGKQFIFYAGRAQPHKNLPKLIKAFEELHKRNTDLHLALVGKHDASYEAIVRLAAASSAKDNIIFTGFVSDAELKWLYQNAEAYVFPSLSEGFGLPGLEAMVHGCPVVSSNATCLPEVYGDAAVYFDPNNAQEMADKINEVITNKKLRKELIGKGYKQAAKYSWRRMAEQTLTVYKQNLS